MGDWVSDEERIRKDGVMSDDKNILYAGMKLAKTKLLYKICLNLVLTINTIMYWSIIWGLF